MSWFIWELRGCVVYYRCPMCTRCTSNHVFSYVEGFFVLRGGRRGGIYVFPVQ